MNADFTPLVTAAANTTQSIAETSLLASLAIMCIFIAAVCVWTVIRQAKECSESTKEVVNNNTVAINSLKDSNKDAFYAVQLAIVDLKSNISNMENTRRG